ncbi:uncharacterized protein OCT59_021024 [Rhizophagus irregularis]|uniref:uncharacterized protein n=1 Tax=Rhizophagus irregularis TaxID=588596 RepID=UPI003332A3E8|nr:hypothetical protein OCT59_021024 [Rhizophagus irregularis]
MAGNKFLPKLSQNLLEILDDDEYYDITIEVGNDPNVKIFKAHMVILNYRSPYLRRILSTNKKNNDGTLVHIKLPNISPEIFQIILRYIYGGKLTLEEYDDISDIFKILVTANELSLQELNNYLQSFLVENNASWIEQNFNLVYQTSFKNDSFLELQSRPSGKSIPRKYIDSKIITIQHVELISKWIDRSASYEFKLMLCGSRDGFSVNKFHEICDNQPRTVTIVKVKGSDKILGGYNPVEWKSAGDYSSTKDSFIFSFDNSNSIENHILSRVKNENKAIWNGEWRSYSFGPSFGNSDLILYGNDFYDMSHCRKHSYEKEIRETEEVFSVEEIEVYHIIKN